MTSTPPALYRGDVIRHLSKRCGITEAQATLIYEALFSPRADEPGIITEALCMGSRIVLTGFGTFFTRVREAGERRNPVSWRAMEVPSRTGAHFRAGKQLRQVILYSHEKAATEEGSQE